MLEWIQFWSFSHPLMLNKGRDFKWSSWCQKFSKRGWLSQQSSWEEVRKRSKATKQWDKLSLEWQTFFLGYLSSKKSICNNKSANLDYSPNKEEYTNFQPEKAWSSYLLFFSYRSLKQRVPMINILISAL